MEDSILNLMLLATLLFILKLNLYPRTIAAAVSLGLLITLTVYSRLDAVFLCFAFFPIALACLLIDARPWMAGTVIPTLLRLSIAGIIPVLAVLGYIYLNSLYFDTATPISGKLKSTFPDIVDVAPYWLGASFTQKISIVLVLIQTPIIIGLGIIRRLSRKPSAPVLVLAVWSTYISLFVLYQLLFGKWANTSGWYRLPLMLVLTASFFLVVDIVVGRMQQLGFRRLGTAAIGMTILVAAAAGFRYLDIHSRQTEAFPVVAREVGKWVQHNTDEDAIFALKDTGAFGYFSDRRVINLDGLVNTKEYQDFAVENGISRYFDRENVSYIVAQSLGEFPDEVKSGDYCSHDQAIHSFMYDTTMGSYTVYREDEVFRLPYQKGKKYWVIWKRTTDSDAESRCPG